MSTELLPALAANGHAAIVTPAAARFSLADVQAMAEMVARSRMFPGVDSPQAACALMLLCQADGLHPMAALRRFHIIEGRPAKRADAIQADFQDRGGRIRPIRVDAEVAEAEFSHATLLPEPITVRTTFQEYHDAGVTLGKYNEKTRQRELKDNWRKYPSDMLWARLVSRWVRRIDPGAVVGIYTPEEVADFAPGDLGPGLHDAGPARPGLPSNGTGHGSGAYAPPAVVDEYRRWVKATVAEFNAAWLDDHADADSGETPPGLKDLFNHHNVLANHLVKHFKETGDLEVPEGDRAEASDRPYKLGAVVWMRDRAAVEAEAEAYYSKVWHGTKRRMAAAPAAPEPEFAEGTAGRIGSEADPEAPPDEGFDPDDPAYDGPGSRG